MRSCNEGRLGIIFKIFISIYILFKIFIKFRSYSITNWNLTLTLLVRFTQRSTPGSFCSNATSVCNCMFGVSITDESFPVSLWLTSSISTHRQQASRPSNRFVMQTWTVGASVGSQKHCFLMRAALLAPADTQPGSHNVECRGTCEGIDFSSNESWAS